MISRLLLCTLIFFSFTVFSAENSSSQIVYSSVDNTKRAPTVAEMWNLTEADMAKYDLLMKGPRGTFSPDVAPPLILALEESNPSEKRRYVVIYAELEHDRTTKDLQTARLYDQVFKELYTEPAIDNTILFKDNEEYIRDGDVFVIFIDSKCLDCKDRLLNGLMKTASFPRNSTDIFVKNLDNQNELHLWAKNNSIKVEDVQKGNVTLNLMQNHTAHILKGKDYAIHVLRNNALFLFLK